MSLVFLDWKTEIPEEVRQSSSIIRLMIASGDFSVIKQIIKISFEFLIAKTDDFVLCRSQISDVIGENFKKPLDSLMKERDEKDINYLLTSIYLIIQSILKNKIKLSEVRKELTRLDFDDSVIEVIIRGFLETRQTLEQSAISKRVQFPRLEKLRWRVDVTISCSVLQRVMRPNILFQTIFKDGSVKTFEVSIEQFNQLRYSVAKALNEMITLERHPIIKIVNEFKKREDEDCQN